MDRAAHARCRAVQAVARAAREPDQTPQGLYTYLGRTLAACLNLRGLCWHITDPQTGIPVLSGSAGHPPGDFERSLEFEFARDDVLRFADLAQRRRTVGVLSQETGGMPDNSPRWREMIEPEGGADEMRASFSDAFGVWGSLSLFADRRFTPDEAEMLAELAPVFTQGLRLAIARMPAGATAPDTQPTVVVLDGQDRIVAADLRARSLVAGIAGDAPGEIPGSFFVLAAQARQRNPTRPACARAQHRDGNWVSIDASPLDDEPHGSVALSFNPRRCRADWSRCFEPSGSQNASEKWLSSRSLGAQRRRSPPSYISLPGPSRTIQKASLRKPAYRAAGRSQRS